MAADDPPHGGITAQTVGVVHVIVATKTAINGLAKLPDHAMPPVLAGTAVLEKAPGNLGQAKGIVKLPVGDKPSVGGDLAWNRGTQASVDGRNRPANGGFLIHPPGDIGFARNADGIALILIAESAKQVIKLVIHLGNPGLIIVRAFLFDRPAGEATRKSANCKVVEYRCPLP